MRDYSKKISTNEVYEILNMLAKQDIEPTIYPGNFLENYFFEDLVNVKIGNIKPRRFVAITEDIQGNGKVNYFFQTTDDEEKFEQISNMYFKNGY